LFHSNLLREYVDRTAEVWKRWESDGNALDLRKKQFLKSVGDGLLSFVAGSGASNKTVLMKTPNPRNLLNIFDLFPACLLLILIRDGRDATESQVQAGTFASHEAAFTTWGERTRDLMAFMRQVKTREGSCMLTRYEDLVLNPETSFNSIASFLGNSGVFIDHKIVERLPVFGSSELGTKHSSRFEWCVRCKPQDFRPIGRWKAWEPRRRDLFKTIAGKELIELGYATDLAW
jgi:hypothetical protein